MESQDKLAILGAGADYDATCATSDSVHPKPCGTSTRKRISGISYSVTGNGRRVALLKVLFTNCCINDCLYCVNRKSANIRRTTFTPEGLASLTSELYRQGRIEGLFLSSGIMKSADYTMERMVQTVKLLRTVHHFDGYIHLKALPGSSPELLLEAGRWADRLSANIELPTEDDLKSLAPEKTHDRIESAMNCIGGRLSQIEDEKKRFRYVPRFAPAGQTTQMMVGATKSSDSLILKKASWLYEQRNVRRIYYSAFRPIPDSSPVLPQVEPPLVREHRLYQADWLFRFYGFKLDELTSDEQPNLDLEIDPKLVWALHHREFFPVDINQAPREELLRVPGLGPTSVERILLSRKNGRITSQDLRRMRVPLKRTKYFVITADRNSALRSLDTSQLRQILLGGPKQLPLFAA